MHYEGFSCFGKHCVFVGPGMPRTFPSLNTSEGKVYCWGTNDYHQCGYEGHESQPRIVAGLPPVLALGLGEDHTLVITEKGVFVWGDNGTHQCGCEKTLRSHPFEGDRFPLGLQNVVAVTGSSYHSLALTGTISYHFLEPHPP